MIKGLRLNAKAVTSTPAVRITLLPHYGDKVTRAPAVRITLLPHYGGKVTSYCKLLLPDFSNATDSTLQLQITLLSSRCFSRERKGIDHTVLNPGIMAHPRH